jgi:hypothetical protein
MSSKPIIQQTEEEIMADLLLFSNGVAYPSDAIESLKVGFKRSRSVALSENAGQFPLSVEIHDKIDARVSLEVNGKEINLPSSQKAYRADSTIVMLLTEDQRDFSPEFKDLIKDLSEKSRRVMGKRLKKLKAAYLRLEEITASMSSLASKEEDSLVNNSILADEEDDGDSSGLEMLEEDKNAVEAAIKELTTKINEKLQGDPQDVYFDTAEDLRSGNGILLLEEETPVTVDMSSVNFSDLQEFLSNYVSECILMAI